MSFLDKICAVYRDHVNKRKIDDWEKAGRPLPPPHAYKQKVIRMFARDFNLQVLVETGTYYGDMVEAMKGCFDAVYSIELSKELFVKAQKRFRGTKNVTIVNGDSGREIEKIIRGLQQPALFWLDGHYSAGETAKGDKDTPIYEELEHIFAARDLGHVILIDDARCFGADPSYPTVEALADFIRSRRDNVEISVEGDCIRIVPGKSA